MFRALMTLTLFALTCSAALAEGVGFRNPVANMPEQKSHVALYVMIAAQAYDSVNSARTMSIPGAVEMNPQYKLGAHAGALGYAASFALWDVAEMSVARMFHVKQSQVETYQAEQSAQGIIYTNAHR